MDRHVVLVFTASLPGCDNVRKYYCKHQLVIFKRHKKKSISKCWQIEKRSGPKNVGELVRGCGPIGSYLHCCWGCCLWTYWAAAVVFKQHQLQLSKNQIKALSWCAMEQLGDGLHFFGSHSRNSSRGAQRTPFTCDTLFKSFTPGKDSSYAAQQTL